MVEILEIFADYFGDVEDVAESAVGRLHLTVLVGLEAFLKVSYSL